MRVVAALLALALPFRAAPAPPPPPAPPPRALLAVAFSADAGGAFLTRYDLDSGVVARRGGALPFGAAPLGAAALLDAGGVFWSAAAFDAGAGAQTALVALGASDGAPVAWLNVSGWPGVPSDRALVAALLEQKGARGEGRGVYAVVTVPAVQRGGGGGGGDDDPAAGGGGAGGATVASAVYVYFVSAGGAEVTLVGAASASGSERDGSRCAEWLEWAIAPGAVPFPSVLFGLCRMATADGATAPLPAVFLFALSPFTRAPFSPLSFLFARTLPAGAAALVWDAGAKGSGDVAFLVDGAPLNVTTLAFPSLRAAARGALPGDFSRATIAGPKALDAARGAAYAMLGVSATQGLAAVGFDVRAATTALVGAPTQVCSFMEECPTAWAFTDTVL